MRNMFFLFSLISSFTFCGSAFAENTVERLVANCQLTDSNNKNAGIVQIYSKDEYPLQDGETALNGTVLLMLPIIEDDGSTVSQYNLFRDVELKFNKYQNGQFGMLVKLDFTIAFYNDKLIANVLVDRSEATGTLSILEKNKDQVNRKVMCEIPPII